MKPTRAQLVLVLALAAPALAEAQSFPADPAWVALRCGSDPATDALRDQPGAVGARDLVGEPQAPVAFRAADAQFLYLRMRLDETPAQGGGLQPFGWGYALDLDDDASDYEALLIVDGQTGRVAVHANTTTTIAGSPADPADPTPLATAPFAQRGRVVQAASTLGGNADHFLDVAVAWSELALVQIDPLTDARVYIGTSTLADRLDDDLACHLGTTGAPSLGSVSPPREPVQGPGGIIGPGGDGGVRPNQTRAFEGGPGCSTAGGTAPLRTALPVALLCLSALLRFRRMARTWRAARYPLREAPPDATS